MADEHESTQVSAEGASAPAPVEGTPAPAPAAPRSTLRKKAVPAAAEGEVDAVSHTSDAAAPEAPERPRRRGRKPAAVASAETSDVPQAGDDAKPAPKRTRRTRKAASAADASAAAPEAELSPEVAQARALAQVSQASVVRRQRRAAEQAAEMIAAPTRKKAGERAAKAPAAADAAAPAAPVAPGEITIPLVDPALRPHRRGRKPKAYVEAERAAAAALAAACAQQEATANQGEGDAKQQDSAASERTRGEDQAAPTPAADVRPGRGRRAKAAKAEQAAEGKAAEKRTDRDASAKTDAPESHREPASADEGKPAQDGAGHRRVNRRTHAAQGSQAGSENAGAGHNDRRDKRQQRNGKQRNNRYGVPTEPSLSREDLAAMKVAELREKARELEIDPTGKKKPELVEEVYNANARAEGFRDVEGVLELGNEGFGHLRVHGYMPSRDDAFVPANLIRAARLRPGDYIEGTVRPSRANDKYPALAKIRTVNGLDPEEIKVRPKFADLTPIYPNEPLKMEHGKDSITGRAIDIVAPVGKGQRGLIVSPPKAGKTTILKKICQAIAINNPEVHVICLLVDERPEEVTDMKRSIKGEVVASTFDMPADNHTRVAELVIERAKRIVELGGDVVVVLDSITRLARAYNLAAPASGRILSGGVDSAALYPPKRFLGAARNIENGGSLTILASALVDTGSKMDEVIFEEFKGTGNMELKLDRDLADRRIFPAIDPIASGTRNEDLLIDEQMRPFVWGIRRVLASMSNTERCASAFIKGLRGTNSNSEFLIRSAKRAQEHGEL